jgi:hypothetical protein
MFNETKKYKRNDHFFLRSTDDLQTSCNAPKNSNGVFIVYELVRGQIMLAFIGSSGKIQKNGFPKKTDSLYNEIVNAPQFGDLPRKMSWIKKLKDDKADGLDIYWYETFNEKTKDIPSFVEALLLQRHFDIYGRLPDWNKEF